jgi:hypothetical protein
MAYGKSERGWIWWIHFILMCENKRMKLWNCCKMAGRGWGRTMGKSKIYYKYLGKYLNVSPCTLLYVNTINHFKKEKIYPGDEHIFVCWISSSFIFILLSEHDVCLTCIFDCNFTHFYTQFSNFLPFQ